MASDKMLAANAEEKNEDDTVISMVDYLKEEQELEEDANALLGDCDDNQCTYPLGYRARQALYSCETCKMKDNAPAAVCLACSYACHEGHDLVELYTKRNFCCDCGNAKFGDLTCKLVPEKDDFNTKNVYNQNFKGLYCICSRPYPDPEDEIEDEMIQCVVCEDWYHGRHLGDNQCVVGDYQDMICVGCMNKHDFLWSYTVHSIETQKLKSDSSTSEVDVEKSDKPEASESECKAGTEEKKEESQYDGNANVKEGECLLEELKKREITVKSCATFWPESFRSKLCVCARCMAMYKEQNIEFLLDESDTVAAYEKRGQEKKTPTTQQDREKRLLEGMDRVQQIEMVQGFNDMKSALSDYLKDFAESGKVVTADDIQEFFSQMRERKRQKVDHTPANFCR